MNPYTYKIRTIKSGRVQIDGVSYAPDEQYHGELDGEKLVFAVYKKPFSNSGKRHIMIWGTEEQFNNDGKSVADAPNVINGVHHWGWWTEVDLTNSEE